MSEVGNVFSIGKPSLRDQVHSTLVVWKMLHRRGEGKGRSRSHASALSVVAFAVSTAVFLVVLGGLHAFVYRGSPEHTLVGAFSESNNEGMGSMYVALALFASFLILVPLTTLAGSAARLVAARRDAQLSALRLMGATSGQVTGLTALDAASQALAGALFGIVGYIAALPVISLLSFEGKRLAYSELWVGPLALITTVVGVTLLALASALITLRRVVISPLGVSARVAAAGPGRWRLWVFVAAVILTLAASQIMNIAGLGMWVAIAIFLVPVVVTFFVINLLGPLIIRARAKSRLKHARNAATLLAAVSSGVMQAGNVYDQQGQYRMLILEGADEKTLAAARRTEVMTPLRVVVAVAGGSSVFLMLPVMGQFFSQPATLLSLVGGIALCFVLVFAGALASNRVAKSLNLTDFRPDD